jgi:phage FluMu protein Com
VSSGEGTVGRNMRTIRNFTEAPSRHDGPCEEARCGCGSLLARVVGAEVELKCRRCKRVWWLALDGGGPAAVARSAPGAVDRGRTGL